MKKVIALLLMIVLCFSFVSCGSNPQPNENGSQQETSKNDNKPEKFNLYQEWKHILFGTSITFHKDNTVTIYDTEYKYEYDKKLEQVSIHAKITLNFSVNEKDGVYRIGEGNQCFVPAADYEKCHGEALKKIYGDKTVVAVGESYEFENGLKTTLKKIECTDKKSGSFNWHFTFENTTGEEIEIQTENVPLICYEGNAFLAIEFDWNASCTMEDNKIPANASKDIVVSIKPSVDLELDEDEYGYLLIGFTDKYYGRHDYEEEFDGFYIDLIAAMAQ